MVTPLVQALTGSMVTFKTQKETRNEVLQRLKVFLGKSCVKWKREGNSDSRMRKPCVLCD